MSGETTQPSLLSRIRDPADQESWRAFDEKYRELILRYCRSRGLQPADAEDVRQMVMMGLTRAMSNFRYSSELGRFRDYIGRAVRNAITRCISCPASARRTLYLDELDAPAEQQADSADEAWEREWMHHHFREAWSKCGGAFEPRSLAIFERLMVGGKTSEVAASFGVSSEAVHKVRQRVRKHLQGLIAEQIREEEFPERAG